MVDRNVTRRVPASIKDPSVGQAAAGIDGDGGLYDIVSAPADLYAWSKYDGSMPSELTMSMVTTETLVREAP